jgi:hypothetical protein
MKVKRFFLLTVFFLLVGTKTYADDTGFTQGDTSTDNHWVAPPPVDENDRIVSFDLQALYQNDFNLPNTPYSLLDISAKRQLDENGILADGLFRVQKNLSSSDATTDVQLRLARISYLQPWLQVTGGRFDLFENLTPNLFFGGYPLMGIHRVDGIMATIPFSFFFNLGAAKQAQSQTSSPLALSLFYTPSLFSAEQVQYDGSQAFFLSQLRLRLDAEDFQSTIRVNAAYTPNDIFQYSSFNGGATGSIAADLRFNQDYVITGEYGIQNLQLPGSTGALALGFQAAHLGTWGDFSLDQIVLEGQFPVGSSLNNAFTGGNGFNPAVANLPQNSFYLKVRARLKVLFIEWHVTNNQDDYTLDRLTSSSTVIPFTGNFGPGRETNGPGIPLRSFSYNNPGFLIRTGVEF